MQIQPCGNSPPITFGTKVWPSPRDLLDEPRHAHCVHKGGQLCCEPIEGGEHMGPSLKRRSAKSWLSNYSGLGEHQYHLEPLRWRSWLRRIKCCWWHRPLFRSPWPTIQRTSPERANQP